MAISKKHALVKALFPGFMYRFILKCYMQIPQIPYFIFYHKNKKKIESVYDICSDKLSRDTLKAYTQLRLYGNICGLQALAKSKEQRYFDNEVLTLGEDEVFVDLGSFNGNDAKKFAELTENKYKAIYMIEPDPTNYSKCKNVANNLKNTFVFNEVFLDYNGEIFFNATGNGVARISDDDRQNIKVRASRLDSKNLNPAPTFIKMDIEGSEAAALRGAEETIKTNRPKLAVCIYHKPEDIFELPKLLTALLPDAKIYIRQYEHYKYTGQVYPGGRMIWCVMRFQTRHARLILVFGWVVCCLLLGSIA